MKNSINVQGIELSIISDKENDFISLTDMLKAKYGDFFISDWLRNRNTVEFLGIWEQIYNPNFNYGGFATIKSKAGLNNYKLSVKEWINQTNAIGLKAKLGRYGGTYAHKDLAFEFGMWISAEFKIYLIKEFQRLKQLESEKLNLEWNVSRILTKINYRIHTDAISKNLIPEKISNIDKNIIYSNEADILNIALFGMTAKQWKDKNSDKSGNLRDYLDVTQLVCLANIENLNALFIKEKLSQSERIIKLNELAIYQMKILTTDKNLKHLK